MKLKVQYWRIKAKMTQENNSREHREEQHVQTNVLMGFVLQGSKEINQT